MARFRDHVTEALARFSLTRMLRFGVIGASGVVINLAVLQIFFVHLHWAPEFASALAVEAAIIGNFLGNNWWTFEQRTISLFRFGKYNLVALGGLVITTAVFTGLMRWFGMSYILADLIGIGAAMTWNFTASVLWAWGS